MPPKPKNIPKRANRITFEHTPRGYISAKQYCNVAVKRGHGVKLSEGIDSVHGMVYVVTIFPEKRKGGILIP
jgi:hypothetical protein